MQLFYKIYNAPITTEESTSGKSKLYHWEMNDLTSVKSEAYQPSSSKILPYIEISPSEFQINNLTGKMSDWKAFGKFMYELNIDRDKLSVDMTKRVQDMVAKCTTNREKIDTLYHYLQQNMRYVSVQLGIGGWQTYDAQYVSKNKYGDCKALSNFMKAMLNVVGIKSYLTIVSSGDKNYFDPNPNFCNPSFNHMILHIPIENMWLECTSSDNPTGYLGSFTAGRGVLLITEEGGQIVQTPPLSTESNTQTSSVSIVLAENGSAILKNTAILRGSLQDDWRMMFKNMSKEELKKGFQSHSKIPSFQFNNFETVINYKQPEVQLNYELAVDKYAAKSGTRLFIPINLHNVFDDTPTPTEKRIHPIEVSGSGYSESDNVSIDIPIGYEVENIPTKAFDLKSEYGSYKASIEQNADKINFKRQLTILPTSQPAEKFNDFRDFYKKNTAS